GWGARIELGEGSEVLAALWGAVARIRDLVTIQSSGAVRFVPSGPEGALPVAAWIGTQDVAGAHSRRCAGRWRRQAPRSRRPRRGRRSGGHLVPRRRPAGSRGPG